MEGQDSKFGRGGSVAGIDTPPRRRDEHSKAIKRNTILRASYIVCVYVCQPARVCVRVRKKKYGAERA